MNIRLKEIMREKGFTSIRLSQEIGVSKVTISNLINNKTAPSIETIGRIADALNVPLWQLFATPEEAGGVELNALIEHKGEFYKATTLKELENAVADIKDKMQQE